MGKGIPKEDSYQSKIPYSKTINHWKQMDMSLHSLSKKKKKLPKEVFSESQSPSCKEKHCGKRGHTEFLFGSRIGGVIHKALALHS